MAGDSTNERAQDALRRQYVGKDITEIPKPAAILDVSISRRHCQTMLAAAKALNLGFRAHVKTHKTIELAKLQVGDGSGPAKFVVSTVAEIEHLLPLFREFRQSGRQVSVLYGIPLPPSQATRVAKLAKQLGEGSLIFMIDHPSQLASLRQFKDQAGFPGGIFLKVDTGYHRAGLPPKFLNKGRLIEQILKLEADGEAFFEGLYSHNSLSYKNTTPEQAIDSLLEEIHGCIDALKVNSSILPKERHLTISVGASPQVTAVENFASLGRDQRNTDSSFWKTIDGLASGSFDGIKAKLELHAGVYAVMDMQQLSTHARSSLGTFRDEVALSVIAEVVSVYGAGERAKPEALVAVGSLGLGREPCPSYEGWGYIDSESTREAKEQLIVERVSQEHSILSWGTQSTTRSHEIPLEVGQSVRIYPNHACVTGAMYKWYFVVDSSVDGSSTKIVDVWVRASGW